MKLFMDNVPSLAIQAPIVREVPSMFCPTAVCSMDADIVMRIAGESDEKTLYREELLRQLNILHAGARICKQYAIRSKPGDIALPLILQIRPLTSEQPAITQRRLSLHMPSNHFPRPCRACQPCRYLRIPSAMIKVRA
jgi:hypothetical protein